MVYCNMRQEINWGFGLKFKCLLFMCFGLDYIKYWTLAEGKEQLIWSSYSHP